MEKKFEDADYYDVSDDCETLTHGDALEALEQALDNAYERDESLADTIKRESPITIYAWFRRKASTGFGSDYASRLVESFLETFDEEYGDPNGNHDPWTDEEHKTLVADIGSVLDQFVSKADVWQCEVGAEREYDEAELMEMFKDEIQS